MSVVLTNHHVIATRTGIRIARAFEITTGEQFRLPHCNQRVLYMLDQSVHSFTPSQLEER